MAAFIILFLLPDGVLMLKSTPVHNCSCSSTNGFKNELIVYFGSCSRGMIPISITFSLLYLRCLGRFKTVMYITPTDEFAWVYGWSQSIFNAKVSKERSTNKICSTCNHHIWCSNDCHCFDLSKVDNLMKLIIGKLQLIIMNGY